MSEAGRPSGSIGSQNFFYTRQDGGGLCFGIKDDLHSKRLRGIADRGNFLSQESARGCILLAELFELGLLFRCEGGTRLPLILSIRHGSIRPAFGYRVQGNHRWRLPEQLNEKPPVLMDRRRVSDDPLEGIGRPRT